MKYAILSVVAVSVLTAGAARAADIPVHMPAKAAPVEVYSWTGFYLGANVGYAVAADPSSQALYLGGVIISGRETFDLSPRGIIGGAQIGYNWQASPHWVFGIEADIQASDQSDSKTCVTRCSPFTTLRTEYTQQIDWFGTVRGRLGWTNGPTLIYATGGWAYGRVSTDIVTGLITGNSLVAVGYSQNKSGWTAGGGLESQIAGNWTAKIEYLYINLGNVNASLSVPAANPTLLTSSDIRNHVARAGLNYKFGASVAGPAVDAGMIYKAPPATTSWSGLYLGANLGYAVASDPSGLVSTVAFTTYDTFNLVPRGVIGGGQIGYDLQFAPAWVAGVEADFQASGRSSSANCVISCTLPPAANIFFGQIDQDISWFGTVRGRFGWANAASLFYVTGGWAFGRVTTNLTMNLNSAGIFSATFTDTKSGWTAGGGIETHLAGN